MPAHTRVLPDAAAGLSDGTINAIIMKCQAWDIGSTQERIESEDFGKHANRIIQAIENKHELHIRPGFNSIIALHKYGNRYIKWVSDNMQS
jgi:hypothetical protein